MTVANPYIAQARLQNLKRYLPVSPNRPADESIPSDAMRKTALSYEPNARLADDRVKAMQMLHDIEEICRALPGTDCGSCGAPTCSAFAEDIIKGETNADECTVIMRALFHDYLEQHKEKAAEEALKPLNYKKT